MRCLEALEVLEEAFAKLVQAFEGEVLRVDEYAAIKRAWLLAIHNHCELRCRRLRASPQIIALQQVVDKGRFTC